MRALLDEFGTAGTVLLYRIRDRADAVFRAELDDLTRQLGIQMSLGCTRHTSDEPADCQSGGHDPGAGGRGRP